MTRAPHCEHLECKSSSSSGSAWGATGSDSRADGERPAAGSKGSSVRTGVSVPFEVFCRDQLPLLQDAPHFFQTPFVQAVPLHQVRVRSTGTEISEEFLQIDRLFTRHVMTLSSTGLFLKDFPFQTPQPDRAVITAAGDHGDIGEETCSPHRRRVAFQHREASLSSEVPDSQGAVARA